MNSGAKVLLGCFELLFSILAMACVGSIPATSFAALPVIVYVLCCINIVIGGAFIIGGLVD